VLGLAIAWRARAALVKAACMASFGAFVLARAIWSFVHGGVPEPLTMGYVAVLALCVNVGVALMLYRYRSGDSNMRSVWVCSRNDALGTVAVGRPCSACWARVAHGPTGSSQPVWLRWRSAAPGPSAATHSES
jgi:hypothetical protein